MYIHYQIAFAIQKLYDNVMARRIGRHLHMLFAILYLRCFFFFRYSFRIVHTLHRSDMRSIDPKTTGTRHFYYFVFFLFSALSCLFVFFFVLWLVAKNVLMPMHPTKLLKFLIWFAIRQFNCTKLFEWMGGYRLNAFTRIVNKTAVVRDSASSTHETQMTTKRISVQSFSRGID